jgi:hypothetical protein
MRYTTQYELLRSEVIGTAGSLVRGNTASQPRGIGLALLLTEGVPGWVRALESVLRGSLARRVVDWSEPSPREASPQFSTAPTWLPSVQRQEVTALLASLVLSTQTVAHQSSGEGYRSW